MARLTAQEAVEKLITRTKNATGDYQRGIDRVTVAPGQRAAAKKEKMRQGVMQAIDDGTWERNVAAVSLEEWKSKAKNKGSQRISAGLDEAKPKMVSTFQQLFEHIDTIGTKLENMPDLTPEQREERMLFQVREMRKFKKR